MMHINFLSEAQRSVGGKSLCWKNVCVSFPWTLVTIRGAQPSPRFLEEICFSEASARVSMRGSMEIALDFWGFHGSDLMRVTLSLWPWGTVQDLVGMASGVLRWIWPVCRRLSEIAGCTNAQDRKKGHYERGLSTDRDGGGSNLRN